jgi:hypothetical protein
MSPVKTIVCDWVLAKVLIMSDFVAGLIWLTIVVGLFFYGAWNVIGHFRP